MTNYSTSPSITVSVVIPTNNRPSLLCRAVRSVFNQTLDKSLYEVIIVDDNSTENIFHLINSYPVKYIKNETTLGGGASRNIGIRNAIGTYIAFLDDDDEWLPEKLEVQLAFMKSKGCDFSSTGFCYYDGDNKLRRKYYGEQSEANSKEKILVTNFIGTTSSVVIKRQVLDVYGGFDISFEALQDYELWTRLLLGQEKYICINELLVNYYIHKNIRISVQRDRVYLGSVRYYLKFKEEIRDHKLRRYWLSNLIRLKGDIYKDSMGANAYRHTILKAFFINKKNIKRLLLFLFQSINYNLLGKLQRAIHGI